VELAAPDRGERGGVLSGPPRFRPRSCTGDSAEACACGGLARGGAARRLRSREHPDRVPQLSILENLDLRKIPEGRYELIALPLKLVGCDSSPVRAVLRELA
jgi:hypothetical protein